MSTTSRRNRSARPCMSVAARRQHDELVTLEVGPGQKRYLLHKGFLIHYSDYFVRVLEGPRREVGQRSIPLDGVDPGIFNVFVNFIYTRDFPCDKECLSMTETNGDPNAADIIDLLVVKAVVFGERYLASDFKETATSELRARLLRRSPSFEAIIYAFQHLTAASTLLDELVEAHCRSWKPGRNSTSDEGQARLPRDFLLRVMRRYGENKGVSQGDDPQARLKLQADHVPVADDDNSSSNTESDSGSAIDSGSGSGSEPGSESNSGSDLEGDPDVENVDYKPIASTDAPWYEW